MATAAFSSSFLVSMSASAASLAALADVYAARAFAYSLRLAQTVSVSDSNWAFGVGLHMPPRF